MTRHIVGRIEVSYDEGKTPKDTPAQSFEIWDDNPDILVRFYLDGQLAREDSLRGTHKVSLDMSGGAGGYARIDDGQPIEQARRNSLGIFLVGPEYLAQLYPGRPSKNPPGTAYKGKPGTYVDKIVIDSGTGFLTLSKPLRGQGEPTLRIFYDLDEQVESGPPATELADEGTGDGEPTRYEGFDYNPASVAKAFGLTTLPQIAGLTLDASFVFRTLDGTLQSCAVYLDGAGSAFTAQHIGEQLYAREAYGPKTMDNLMVARVVEESAYLDFIAPDLAGLNALGDAFRPGLVL